MDQSLRSFLDQRLPQLGLQPMQGHPLASGRRDLFFEKGVFLPFMNGLSGQKCATTNDFCGSCRRKLVRDVKLC
jgi:hypothetical protein